MNSRSPLLEETNSKLDQLHGEEIAALLRLLTLRCMWAFDEKFREWVGREDLERLESILEAVDPRSALTASEFHSRRRTCRELVREFPEDESGALGIVVLIAYYTLQEIAEPDSGGFSNAIDNWVGLASAWFLGLRFSVTDAVATGAEEEVSEALEAVHCFVLLLDIDWLLDHRADGRPVDSGAIVGRARRFSIATSALDGVL